jgi:hypothetical protein
MSMHWPLLLIRLLPRSNRGRVISVISGLLIVLIITSGIWSIRIGHRAGGLARDIRATTGAAQDTIASTDPDPTEIASLRALLIEILPRTRDLESDLWPLRFAGALIGWYPVLGDNVQTAPKLASRLVDDVDAALSFLDAGEQLILMYESIPVETSGITATLAAMPSQERIDSVRSLILQSHTALSGAEATANKVNDRRLWGRLGSEAEELRNQEAELRDLVDWSLLVTDSLSALARLSDESEGLTRMIDTGDTSDLDGSVLRRMPILEIRAKRASTAVSITVDTAPDVMAETPIGRIFRDLKPVLKALHATSRAGSLVSAVITPAFEPVESSNSGLFGPGTGLLESIALIGDGTYALREADLILSRSKVELSEALPLIETPSAAAAVEGLLSLSDELGLAIGLLQILSDLGPPALGVGGERKYLVMAESSDEIRPSGGLVSGTWILTFLEGELVNSTYHDVVEIDDLTNLESYPTPPDLLAMHMDASAWLLRDVGWEPHFPSVARSSADIVALGQDGLDLDGVIALTQWATIGLVEALGSIDTDSGVVPADEILNVLEVGTDEDGRVFMNSVMQGFLDQLNGPAINGRLFRLARNSSQILNEKQILVHMFDDDLQAIVSEAGWDGGITDFTGDRIALVDSNIGWSKVDRNIDRSLKYEVTLNRTEPSTARVTVGYKNRSLPEASECDAQRLRKGASYSDLKNTCYWNLLRIYTADGVVLISADPLPLPGNSILAARGLGGAGDDTVAPGSDPGGLFFSGLIVVPPGGERRTSFTMQLPDSIVEWDEDRATYTLELNAQPGAQGRDTMIWVEMPVDYEYVDGSVKPTSVAGGRIRFDLPLTKDTTLTVEMQQRPASNTMSMEPDSAFRAV